MRIDGTIGELIGPCRNAPKKSPADEFFKRQITLFRFTFLNMISPYSKKTAC
jgi:hypothetical protein